MGTLCNDKSVNKLQAGKLLGDMTVVQAIMRPLEKGETRPKLLMRCAKGIKKKLHLSCDSRLAALLPQPQTTNFEGQALPPPLVALPPAGDLPPPPPLPSPSPTP